ncbi:XRE family transcriptional regulator [Steroidobacter denitrificans]|uniref:XRE family transcriptional regulator n=1 Tax=Steroidobacter denitrificans TaxID=465721 RepID=A0A127FD47_STEDE|nr:helix-turn-helix transcriptional regulator [Steroidobacter denitrificans]AMN48323.1 XRE family transcriptional regulator [Steroidobacter denitrificans]
MTRPTFDQFRKKALRKPGVKAEYEALATAFEMKRRMIALRRAAGLTQEQMAEKLGTRKSNISRLESVNSDVSPRLSTLENYARVLGYQLVVEFEPRAR